MQCIRKSAKGAVGMEAQMYAISARKIPHLLCGSSYYCLAQILDGAIDQDALE